MSLFLPITFLALIFVTLLYRVYTQKNKKTKKILRNFRKIFRRSALTDMSVQFLK